MATFLVVAISGVDMDTSHHEVDARNSAHAEFLVFCKLGCPDYFESIEVALINGTAEEDIVDFFEVFEEEEIQYCPPSEENYDIPF